MKTPKLSMSAALVGLALLGMQPAIAQQPGVQLPSYNDTYPVPNAACATFGNLVSCSTGVLDYLANTYPERGFLPPPDPYSFPANEGSLHASIVVTANGGETLYNGDQIAPSEDGFTTNNGGTKNYFFTGDANDPVNNGTLLTGADTPYSWDVGLAALNQKLTFGGAYHQLLIAFDFNNPQGSVSSIPIWSTVTIRDVDGSKPDVVVETQALDPNNVFKDPALFESTKNFATDTLSQLHAGDFAMTTGAICVVSPVVSYPSPDGTSCPTTMGGGYLIITNRASSAVEFINYFPTLDLKGLEASGYDTFSAQVWTGCFGGTDPKNGPAVDGGVVGPCDRGGYGDIFLLAGNAIPDNQTPEPGTLALLGASLLGLIGWRRSAA
ncbi:PEP-CTERM sorting domain-containing protein [Rhodocyclus purpureus]|uniref:PEP-CTERM sorting domain-containing protein n=1 Tax=Rhodocyclus purpureus TaxID=1067 RepID=UPI001912746D|nr:PEP-CTERM sorting domain-containing protein [Rhodocyclus purpureus]MBK5913285.1 hypothetical protein [Rhodocyclus purpureus]